MPDGAVDLWGRDGQPKLLVYQPRGMDWRTLLRLIGWARVHDLQIGASAALSYEEPGTSIALIIQPAEPVKGNGEDIPVSDVARITIRRRKQGDWGLTIGHENGASEHWTGYALPDALEAAMHATAKQAAQ